MFMSSKTLARTGGRVDVLVTRKIIHTDTDILLL